MYTIKIDKCAKFHVETRMQGSVYTKINAKFTHETGHFWVSESAKGKGRFVTPWKFRRPRSAIFWNSFRNATSCC